MIRPLPAEVQLKTKARQADLLGHPQPLDGPTILNRRAQAAGLPITRAQAQSLYGSVANLIGDSGFTINLSALVIDELTAGLNVVSLQGGSNRARKACWDFWERSGLEAGTEGLFEAAATDGQAFLVLDFDHEGQPVAFVNCAFDGETGIEVKAVDSDGTLTAAVKYETEQMVRDRATGRLRRVAEWALGLLGWRSIRDAVEFVDRRRRTLYVYDTATGRTTIRYFLRDPGRDEVEVDEQDNEVETGTAGREWEFGFPVVPFVAPDSGRLGDLETPQRLVNSAAIDLAAAAQVDGLRIAYTMDCKAVSSGGSRSGPMTIKPGTWLELKSTVTDGAGRGGSIGTLPPANLEAQMAHYELQVRSFFRQARSAMAVRPENQAAEVPSGAAMEIAARPYKAKVQRHAERYGMTIRRMFETVQRMAGAPVETVDPVWRPVDWTTMAERLDNAIKAQTVGFHDSFVFGEVMGMTPESQEEARQHREEVRAERATVLTAMAGGRSGDGQLGADGGQQVA